MSLGRLNYLSKVMKAPLTERSAQTEPTCIVNSLTMHSNFEEAYKGLLANHRVAITTSDEISEAVQGSSDTER